jgi:hypothetical protein
MAKEKLDGKTIFTTTLVCVIIAAIVVVVLITALS